MPIDGAPSPDPCNGTQQHNSTYFERDRVFTGMGWIIYEIFCRFDSTGCGSYCHTVQEIDTLKTRSDKARFIVQKSHATRQSNGGICSNVDIAPLAWTRHF